ncbi:hypothetical protein ACWIG4_13420 [Streptomyces sp. NPDC002248]
MHGFLDLAQLVFHTLGGPLFEEDPLQSIEINGVLSRLYLPFGAVSVHREGVEAGQLNVLEPILVVQEERQTAARRQDGDRPGQDLLHDLSEIRLSRSRLPPGLKRWVAGDANVAGNGRTGVLDDQQKRPVVAVGLNVDDDVWLVLLPVDTFRENQLLVCGYACDSGLPGGDKGGDDGNDDRPLVGRKLIRELTLPTGADRATLCDESETANAGCSVVAAKGRVPSW